MKTVKLYTTRTCGFCIAAKNFLTKEGIPFEDVDVTADQETRRDAAEKYQWQTVPMILIGEEFVGGYTELMGLARSGLLDEKLGR